MATLKSKRPIAQSVYQSIPVEDLTGGLDLRRSPTLLKPSRSVVCRNFSLAEPGALTVRPGFASFSTLLSTKASQGAQRVYLGSTQGTLVAVDGAIRVLFDNGSWSSVMTSGLSTINQIFFPFDRNMVGALDGSTWAQKSTDLITWTRLGIAPGTAPTTNTVGGAGGELSTSEFAITYSYKDRGLSFISDPSTAQSTARLTSTGPVITVNVKNSTDPQVDAIVLWAKNVTAGETVFRKASSFAQSAGVSSTGTINSSAWSANDEAPSTHGVPPVLSFGVVWKNRWWAKSAEFPTRLHFSEIFQPQGWPALYYIDLPFANGDEIAGIKDLGDTLLVFGHTPQIFLIIGQTSLDFEVRPSLGAQAGAVGPRAVAGVEAGVVHVSPEGVYIFDGASDRLLSHDQTPGFVDMIDNSPSTSIANIPVVFDRRTKELRVAVPRVFPTGTPGEWVLDLNRTREGDEPAWAQTDRPIRHYISWDGDEPTQGNRGKLQSLSSTGVKVFTESEGTSADGSDMVAEYNGPTLSAGLHRGRFIDLHAEYEPHAGNFSAEPVVDGQSMGSIPLSIGSGLATYGVSEYGLASYGGAGRRKAHTMLPLNSEGRNYQQNFVYEGQEAFTLFNYAVGLTPEPNVRTFSE